MKRITLLIILIMVSACSSVNYRLALRVEEKEEFNECYAVYYHYPYCKRKSFSNMNKKHNAVMMIKERFNP
jgi:hypothetical protein